MNTAKNFNRDTFTWLSYGMAGFYSYLLAILGPAVAFLVVEFKLDYTISSLFFAAFAIGMFAGGFVAYPINRAIGRWVTFWGGAAGMTLGGLLIAVSGEVVVALAGACLMGLSGALLLIAIQASLAEHQGPLREFALTESNIIGGIGASLSAWVIGLASATWLGWRTALWVTVPVIIILLAIFGRRTFPALPLLARPEKLSPIPGRDREPKLPLIFWLFWVIGFLAVSTEWCIGFWNVDFLTRVTGLTGSDAALLMGLYFLVTVLSRLVFSRLIRRLPASFLLPVSAAFLIVGFPFFWLSQDLLLSVFSLLVMGTGIANLAPLTLAAAIGVVPAQPDLASARITSGSGLALLVSPLILGWLANQFGIQPAYSYIFILAIFLVILTGLAFLKTKAETALRPNYNERM